MLRDTAQWLGACAASSAVGNAAALFSPAASPAAFRHRGYLGWITDLSTLPRPHAAWPSIEIDQALLNDYSGTFDRMHRLGFNEITIWGLYVSRSWPLNIDESIGPERRRELDLLLDAAHRNKIRVYSGLGVYSWGFEEIIKAHPSLSRGNPRAMCASEPESWNWMRRVVDFVFRTLPIDGVSMQSADQGRCPCDRCAVNNDAEYHVRLNIRVSEYIRENWPGKTVAVNGWGMNFKDPNNLPAWVEMSRKIDYLIDVRDSTGTRDPNLRRKFIQSLACDFGTIGGPQVEPPQHWRRDRWFLPTAKRDSEHLTALAADGGRACEYFFHILDNPGDEISFYVVGKVLADPATSWQKHLSNSIEELYNTKADATSALAGFFLRAEDAYLRHLPNVRSGTISLEPLVSDRAGVPVYLTQRLDASARRAYRDELLSLRNDFQKLAASVPAKDRMRRILVCIESVLGDIQDAGT